MNIRLPAINAPTADGAIQQIKSYLFQLAEQLNIETESEEKLSAEDVEKIINNAVKPLEQRIKRLEVLINEGDT